MFFVDLTKEYGRLGPRLSVTTGLLAEIGSSLGDHWAALAEPAKLC